MVRAPRAILYSEDLENGSYIAKLNRIFLTSLLKI